MRLYELTEQYEMLLQMALEDPTAADFESMILGMEGAISEKLDNCCKIIKSLEAQEEALGRELARLSIRKASISNNAKRLKESIKAIMQRLELEKHKSPLFTVSVTAPRERLEVIDIDRVPLQYKSLPAPTVDKKAVMEALKAGLKIEGVQKIKGEKGLLIR